MGPYQVIERTLGGSYVLAEMDRTRLDHNLVAFHLIPYVLRRDLDSWSRQIDEEQPPDSKSNQEPSDNVNHNMTSHASQNSDI